MVSGRLLDIQSNLVLSAKGNPLQCHFDSVNDKRELKELRNEAKEYSTLLTKNSPHESQETEKYDGTNKFVGRASKIRKLCERISSRVKYFFEKSYKSMCPGIRRSAMRLSSCCSRVFGARRNDALLRSRMGHIDKFRRRELQSVLSKFNELGSLTGK